MNLHSRLLAFVTATLLATASCAQAQVPQVTGAQAIAAVRDCAAATAGAGVGVNKLLALGWERATASGADGKPIELKMVILGRKTGGPAIMTDEPGTQGNRVCVVIGGLKDLAGFDGLLGAMRASFPAIGSKDGEYQFRADRDFALAAATNGGKSFRIAVVGPEIDK